MQLLAYHIAVLKGTDVDQPAAQPGEKRHGRVGSESIGRGSARGSRLYIYKTRSFDGVKLSSIAELFRVAALHSN